MHARISINQLCFPGASPEVLGASWRALGARRVSFISPTLLDGDLEAVGALLREGGHAVDTIAHMFMPGQHLSSEEATWNVPRASLDRLIGIARKIHARSIYMLTGGHGTLTWEEGADAFRAAVAPCLAHARDAGLSVAIENALPLYADAHLAHTLRDTVTLAEQADIGVCIDLFGCWGEADLQATIRRAVPRAKVVQVSDYVYGDRSLPARAVPGDGAIPLQRLLGWILEAGYEGPFDLELIGPRIDAEGRSAAAARAADRLGELLHTLGA